MDYNITVAELQSGCSQAAAQPSLAQWDRGQILKITGVDLPFAYSVEFGVQGQSTTITMIGDAEGVEIPNQLLETGKTITAYVVLHVGEDDRETEYWINIFVRPRPQPSNVAPDPGQASAIDQLIAHLDNAVDAAEAAQTGAETAQGLAEAAQTAAETAQGLAEAAQTGAETAQGLAEDAQTAAETAQGLAEDAAERASQSAAQAGYMFFYIDENGDLIYQHTSNTQVDFYLQNGDLYVKAVA